MGYAKWFWCAALVLVAVIPITARVRVPAKDPGIERRREMGFRGQVSGRVTYQNGAPASGFPAYARFTMHMSGMIGEGSAMTDSNGNYTIEALGPMAFDVHVGTIGKGCIAPPAHRVDLSKGERVEDVDFVLSSGPRVTVRIRDAETGTPLQGLSVKLADRGYAGDCAGYTDSRGVFAARLSFLDTEIRIADPDKKRDYGAAPGSSFYVTRACQPTDDVVIDVLAYRDWGATPARILRGTVQDPSGSPVAGAQVRLLHGSEPLSCTTDAQGQFQIASHRVSQYEEQSGGPIIIATKRPLACLRRLKAADTWSPIKIVMRAGSTARIVGKVVDPEGNPLPDCHIDSWEYFGSSTAQPCVQPSDTRFAGPDGRFEIADVWPDATYSVSVGTWYKGGYLGIVSMPKKASDGQTLHVQAGRDLDLGTIVVPHADRTIEGRITDESGRGVGGNIMLDVKGQYTNAPTYPDADGHFKIEHAVDEPLTVKVFVGNGGTYRTGDESPDLLLTQQVSRSAKTLRLSVTMRQATK